jgi:HSP20 family protein
MHNQRQQDFFKRLDRTLATRYVQEYLGLQRERRSHIKSNENQGPQIWQPRYVVFLFSRRYLNNIYVQRLQLCDDPESTRISATLELPGMRKDDLTIDRVGDRLIISGERRSPVPEDSAHAATMYPVQELKYGKYRRVMNLPPGTQVSLTSDFLIDSHH